MMNTLFPKLIQTAQDNPKSMTGALYPQEEQLMDKAIPKRQQEFRAGRLLSKSLLKGFGIEKFPLLMGANREPLWPEDITGSIAHTKDTCIVALARRADYQGVGVDVEQIGRVTDAVWDTISTDEEKAWYQETTIHPEEYKTITFSAKESVYKCLYPLIKQWIGFADVAILIKPEQHQFVAQFKSTIGPIPKGHTLVGQYISSEHLIYTGLTAQDPLTFN